MIRKKVSTFVVAVVVMALVLSVTAVYAKPVSQGVKQQETTAGELEQATGDDGDAQDKLQQKLEDKQEVREENKSEQTHIKNRIQEKQQEREDQELQEADKQLKNSNSNAYRKAESFKIKAKGHIANFGYPPVLKSDNLLIPLKGISGMLGVEVAWAEQTRSVTLTRPDDPLTQEDETATVEFSIDNPEVVVVNGSEVALDIPPEIIGNSTYVPIRFFAEQLGFKVDFDETTNEVSIDDETETPDETGSVNDETAPAGENAEGGTETDSEFLGL